MENEEKAKEFKRIHEYYKKRLANRDQNIEQLKLDNDRLGKVLKIADVPALIIRHPELLDMVNLTQEDIDWAEEEIKKHEIRNKTS